VDTNILISKATWREREVGRENGLINEFKVQRYWDWDEQQPDNRTVIKWQY